MKNSLLSDQFIPPWWAKNRHLQTLWGPLIRRLPPLPVMKRERLELNDGDFIDLEIHRKPESPTLLLLHGLEGSINSPYIRGMINVALKKGWQIVVMHFRSCSGEPNRLVQSYHSGASHDLQTVVEMLQSKSIKIDYFVGYSLGGNVLLKWLAENEDGKIPVKAAAAVSVPLKLDVCATEINKGFSKIYQAALLRSLKAKTRNKLMQHDSELLPNYETLKKLANFWQFDQAVTAPVHGFKNAQDYYDKVSSGQFIEHIKSPTLIIQSLDDPFMSPEVLPDLSKMPSNVILEKNSHGGHVGFVQGKYPWRPDYYLENRIPEYLAKFE